jgi:hypothetical protein
MIVVMKNNVQLVSIILLCLGLYEILYAMQNNSLLAFVLAVSFFCNAYIAYAVFKILKKKHEK